MNYPDEKMQEWLAESLENDSISEECAIQALLFDEDGQLFGIKCACAKGYHSVIFHVEWNFSLDTSEVYGFLGLNSTEKKEKEITEFIEKNFKKFD